MNLVTFISSQQPRPYPFHCPYNTHLVLVRLFKYSVRLFCSTGSSSTHDHWLKFLLGEGGMGGEGGGRGRDGEGNLIVTSLVVTIVRTLIHRVCACEHKSLR